MSGVRDYVTLLAALGAAQDERGSRREWVDGEIGWVTYEREVMLAETNRLRAERGLPPVDLAAIRVAEQQACGHSDYSVKFALGCESLAAEDSP